MPFRIETALKATYNRCETLPDVDLGIGAWPSGKATGFGPVILGSNPSAPANNCFLASAAVRI
jgi:hypothetical protein